MAVIRVIPSGDLLIEERDFVVYADLDYVRQTIECRLRFGRGEWFLDLSEGVPYYQVVLRKNPDLSAVRALFRRVIMSVPGVVSVPVLTLELDRATRGLSVAFEARCRTGVNEVRTLDEQFVLPLAA